MTYTKEQVSAAANQAADDVLEAIDAPDEGARDVANLVVNATMHYLAFPGDALEDAIKANYENQDPGEVLEWCQR